MSLEKVHPDCYNFVVTVEDLLEKRQQDVFNETGYIDPLTDDWGPRLWTRTEMEDMVYSSYKKPFEKYACVVYSMVHEQTTKKTLCK